jgi:alkylation response protein AidB-like acyl-CoA dehydrogenase
VFVQHPKFGKIVDYDYLRRRLHEVYDQVYPDFSLLGSTRASIPITNNEPSLAVSVGASVLAYSLIVAAEENDMAASLKDKIFTLGWTEEHCGSDLLSIRTSATPLSDAPDERQYHIKGRKWLINNSYFGDYHIVVAKVDPSQDGPRSLSLFLVPHSSTNGWERLETHVLDKMVLTQYNIDGPGTLIGKVGHGLSIIQRMAMASKYQCSYYGVEMVKEAIPATIEHLSTKKIFGDNPVRFGNVFRQLYNLTLQAALMDFMFYRAIVFNDGGFLQFHGTLLKSWLLLRINELLNQNLLVAGSKGYLKESVIGRSAINATILPVFDGHYTINTLMTAKHAERYVNATERVDLSARLERLRSEMYVETRHDEIHAKPLDIRKPPFFDYADYVEQFALPIDLQPRQFVAQVRALLNEMEDRGLAGSAEYNYKTGDLLHWMESVLAACELWKVTGEDNYLNVVVQQYNGLANTINAIISEGGLECAFVQPLRQRPAPVVDDPRSFLLNLMNVESRFERIVS